KAPQREESAIVINEILGGAEQGDGGRNLIERAAVGFDMLAQIALRLVEFGDVDGEAAKGCVARRMHRRFDDAKNASFAANIDNDAAVDGAPFGGGFFRDLPAGGIELDLVLDDGGGVCRFD